MCLCSTVKSNFNKFYKEIINWKFYTASFLRKSLCFPQNFYLISQYTKKMSLIRKKAMKSAPLTNSFTYLYAFPQHPHYADRAEKPSPVHRRQFNRRSRPATQIRVSKLEQIRLKRAIVLFIAVSSFAPRTPPINVCS